jgi:hypothetical protein
MNEFARDGFGPRNEEERVIYAEESFRVDVQVTLHELMSENGLSDNDLMERSGVQDIFSDEAALNIRDLAKIFYALGRVPTIETTPIEPKAKPRVESEEGDSKKREPGCECHLEEGDSPCPVHDSVAQEDDKNDQCPVCEGTGLIPVYDHVEGKVYLCAACERGDPENCSGWCGVQPFPKGEPKPNDDEALRSALIKVGSLTWQPTVFEDGVPIDCTEVMREIRDTLRPHIGVRLPVGAGWHSYISVPVDEYRALERDLAAAKEVSLEANERAKKAEVMSVAARVLLKEDGEMEEKLAKADAKIVELETKLDAAELKAAVPWTKGRAIDHQSCGQTAAKFLKRAVAAETEGVELKTRIAMLEGNLRVAVKESLDRALGKKAAETELAALREKDSK